MKQQSVWKKNNTKRSKPKQRAAFVEQQSVWKKKQTANQNDMLFSLRVELATKAICLNGFSIFIN